MTVNRGRLLDVLLGALVGIFATGAGSMLYFGERLSAVQLDVAQRLAAVESEVKGLRRDFDHLSAR